MVDDAREALQRELRQLDDQLSEMRAELEALRDDRHDSDDTASITRMVDEQTAVIDVLEARRLELVRRLGHPD
jgi:hypothetical protein